MYIDDMLVTCCVLAQSWFRVYKCVIELIDQEAASPLAVAGKPTASGNVPAENNISRLSFFLILLIHSLWLYNVTWGSVEFSLSLSLKKNGAVSIPRLLNDRGGHSRGGATKTLFFSFSLFTRYVCQRGPARHNWRDCQVSGRLRSGVSSWRAPRAPCH